MGQILGAIFVLAGYLLGSISFGLLIAKRRGVDLREFGSGNIGATNAGRALGRRLGLVVMLLDLLKGLLPTLAARGAAAVGAFDDINLALPTPWLAPASLLVPAATGAMATMGHVWPLWHGWRGGKGAATAAGALLAVVPWAGVTALGAFFALRRLTGRASVGSLVGAMLATAVAFAVEGPSPGAAMAMVLLVVVVLRHRDNIRRLARGEEPRL